MLRTRCQVFGTARLRRLFVVALAVALAVCSDEGPVSAPGELTATLVSPNGAEGAALITLIGEGVGEVTSVAGTEAYAFGEGTTTQVVLISALGGELSFRVTVADTLERPGWVVLQVADTDDVLRAATGGYGLEFVP